MALMNRTEFVRYCNRIGVLYDKMILDFARDAVTAPEGTYQRVASRLRDHTVKLGDYDVQVDLNAKAEAARSSAFNADTEVAAISTLVQSLNAHCRRMGPATNASVNSIASYLAYIRTNFPTTPLVHPAFAEAFFVITGTALLQQHVHVVTPHPYANPTSYYHLTGNPVSFDRTLTANGLGSRAVGGAYTAGVIPLVGKFAEWDLMAEVTADFANGTAPATVTVNGIDNTGVAMTWTATLPGGNNPTAVQTATPTPAVAVEAGDVSGYDAGVRLFGSAPAGMIAGTWFTVVSDTDSEQSLAEFIATNPACRLNRAAAVATAIKYYRGVALTPGTGGRKCRSISGITVGVTGHDAGAVRILPVQTYDAKN